MLVALIALTAALTNPQAQSLGAAEGLRPLPQASAPAPARAVSETPPATERASAAEPPRMVCRMVQVTGTRFPVRQCRSSQQSEEERAESREMLRRMQGSRTEPVG